MKKPNHSITDQKINEIKNENPSPPPFTTQSVSYGAAPGHVLARNVNR